MCFWFKKKECEHKNFTLRGSAEKKSLYETEKPKGINAWCTPTTFSIYRIEQDAVCNNCNVHFTVKEITGLATASLINDLENEASDANAARDRYDALIEKINKKSKKRKV